MDCATWVELCYACGRLTSVGVVGRRSRNFGIAYVTNPLLTLLTHSIYIYIYDA